MQRAHMAHIKDNPGVVEKNGIVIFGRKDAMQRIFEMPREMGK